MNLLILPHQLFDKKLLPNKINEIFIYEHPQYFKKYNFNKKKIMLHRASMKYYENYLISKKYTVNYIDFNKSLPDLKEYMIFDPIDKIKFENKPTEILESPNFLLTSADYEKYRKKTKKFFFNGFYTFGKTINDIIPKIKSQDKENRKKLPKDLNLPKLPKNYTIKEKKFIDEAKIYIEKNFKSNYGNTDNFEFPISHNTVKKWFKYFLDKKMKKFGDYQDAIAKGENYLFHSCLSSSINIGLINPKEIIDILRKMKNKYPINSYEGYIRQLYWREYQRYCYIYCDFNCNYFNHKKKLNKKWYDGTLNIEPVDDAIKQGFETGYLHHIYRLMVVGNWMSISEISPKEGLKWFMEFSIDSYEWVMYQNVYDMVFFVTGGKTMRKPYISSSNYIINMSNYSKKDDWVKTWDENYTKFLKKHKEKLWKFRYSFPTLKKL